MTVPGEPIDSTAGERIIAALGDDIDMNTEQLDNVNVAGMEDMPTPEEVQAEVPLAPAAAETVARGRATVRAILDHRDPRLVVVIGPCSIHDPVAALDYAGRLARL